MALRQTGLHKLQDGAGTLAITAEAGESLRVTRIRANDLTKAIQYVEPTIDRKTVGYLRIIDKGDASDVLMNNLAAGLLLSVNIFDVLMARGIPLTYPVAQGQTFRIVCAANVIIDVEYDLFDAGDVKATDENGTESPVFYYIERGENLGTVAIGQTHHRIVHSITPGEFPDFPFGGPAGARNSFEMFAIIGQPCAQGNAGPILDACTERLHLIHERESLLDPDRTGLIFRGDVGAVVGTPEYTRIDSIVGHNLESLDLPLFFNPPLVFEPGSELVVDVTFTAAVANNVLAAGALDVGFLLKETRG